MVAEKAESFGQKCMRILADRRAEQLIQKLSPEECAAVIDGLFTQEILLMPEKRRPRKPAKPRARNELVDGIMAACFDDPLAATELAVRAAAVAVIAIRKVCPAVSVDQLHRAAKRYKQLYPLWTLSPSALSKHWHEVYAPDAAPTSRDVYKAPENWQIKARAKWGNIELPEAWLDLSITLRADLLRTHA